MPPRYEAAARISSASRAIFRLIRRDETRSAVHRQAQVRQARCRLAMRSQARRPDARARAAARPDAAPSRPTAAHPRSRSRRAHRTSESHVLRAPGERGDREPARESVACAPVRRHRQLQERQRLARTRRATGCSCSSPSDSQRSRSRGSARPLRRRQVRHPPAPGHGEQGAQARRPAAGRVEPAVRSGRSAALRHRQRRAHDVRPQRHLGPRAGQLELHYQLEVDLNTGRDLRRRGAGCRWRRSGRQRDRPRRFHPDRRAVGSDRPDRALGHRRSVPPGRRLESGGPDRGRLADVRQPLPVQLAHTEIVTDVAAALARTACRPACSASRSSRARSCSDPDQANPTLAALKSLGCAVGQGFVLGRPAPPELMAEALVRRRAERAALAA